MSDTSPTGVAEHEDPWLAHATPAAPPARLVAATTTERDSTGDQDHGPHGGERAMFRRHSAAELAQLPDAFDWLVARMLAEPTYGQIAGELKTLKTYTALFLAVGLAAGEPVLGHFEVPRPRPVLAYIGEGGMLPFQRRLKRVARAMKVTLDDLPLHVTFDVAPVASDTFRYSLARDLDEIQPGLVWVDPYYAYHGGTVKASSLHEEGDLLTRLSTQCLDGDASLLVANHFNQTGNGSGLKRITMAGSGEWADSWLLLNHRGEPDVANGRFQLDLAIGSRQWGGNAYQLDLDIGRFDPDHGTHDGDITWDLRAAAGAAAREADAFAVVLEVLEAQPWVLTKAQLVAAVGGNATTARGLVDALLQDHRIKAAPLPRQEGRRRIRRVLFALADEPGPEPGPGCPPTTPAGDPS